MKGNGFQRIQTDVVVVWANDEMGNDVERIEMNSLLEKWCAAARVYRERYAEGESNSTYLHLHVL